MDQLFDKLQSASPAEIPMLEGRINRLWSRSGSASMDLLLQRGLEAMQDEDYAVAIEHLTALTDHAPDFAEGWNARATAFFLMGEYGLSIADVQRTLALNPRHFGALSGLGTMLEDLGEDEVALRAYLAAQAVHPHRESINSAVERLSARLGGVEL
ncbi:tetratricopeptide repeat protein [Rhodobacteraceae bacterium KN286]|uniref:Tetratricopeptide repeat protein n=1 Tax=Oceanomicrobium pacificus TaxID=2692916 RepID=A0A6B0TPW0_9RHOB|nr:tetratricopeptide repeat protein [Oceanomicrobium pacificus]